MDNVIATQLTNRRLQRDTAMAQRIRARARQNFMLEDGETVLELRAVTMQEVARVAGSPPALLATMAGGGDREALAAEMLEDTDLVREVLDYNERLTKGVVCVGVTNLKIRDAHPSELEDDEITPADLRADFPRVYNRILEMSGLNLQRLEEAERFQEVADPAGADGGDVRLPAERDSELEPGGV